MLMYFFDFNMFINTKKSTLKKLRLGAIHMKKSKFFYQVISVCLVFIMLVCHFTFVIPVFANNSSDTTVINSKVDPLVYDFDFLSTSVNGTIYKKPETLGWSVISGASETTEVADSVWIIDVLSSEYAVQGEADVAIEAKLYSSFRMKLLNNTAAATATL